MNETNSKTRTKKVLKKNKKAQVEVSFNWIFILLAGAAILAFFIFVITRETDDAEKRTNIQVTKKMEELLSLVEQNPRAIKDLKHFNLEFDFDCDFGAHLYGLKDAESNAKLESQIIFSPKTVGGSNLYAWTKDFEVPYSIASILYLTDDKTMYIFHESSAIALELHRNFPDEFEGKISTTAQITNFQDVGLRKYIFVTDQSQFDDIKVLPNEIQLKSTIVNIKPVATGIDRGKVEFYGYETINNAAPATSFGDSAFVTPQLVYGAIVTGEKKLYDCTLSKLMKRTQFVDEMNLNRINEIYDNINPFGEVGHCRIYYSDIAPNSAPDLIQRKKTAAQKINTDYVDFYSNMYRLQTLNREILRASCPLIY